MESSVSQLPRATGVSAFWRAAAIFFLVLLVLGAAAGVSMFEQFTAQVRDLQQKVQQTAQLAHVAVLVNAKGEPSILLTQAVGDADLQLQRLDGVVEGSDDSMQLWAVPDTGAPRSLGVLTPRLKTLRLGVGPQALDGVGRLAISVEDRGGAGLGQGPRLPWLLTGTVIRKAL